MNTILKIYEKILDIRIREQTNHIISALQGGSQQEKGCVDTHIILQELIHQNKTKQTILCSYDLSKAYDRVNRDLLWLKMRKLGINEHLIQAVISTYSNSRVKINIGKFNSKPVAFPQGIKQGSVLSPILFIIYVNELLENLKQTKLGLTLTTTDEKITIPCLMFVDDLLLIAKNTKELEEMMEILQTFLKSHYAIANEAKTKIMARRNTDKLKKWLRKNKLITQDTLKYLGLTITLNNTWTEHTNTTVEKIRNKHNSIKERGLQWKYLKPLTNINLIKKTTNTHHNVRSRNHDIEQNQYRTNQQKNSKNLQRNP